MSAFRWLCCLLVVAMSATSASAAPKIDRKALVQRHNVVLTTWSQQSPLQVGNGETAFGLDLTGLQTVVPFASMSHWGWYSEPTPTGKNLADFRGAPWDTNGRQVYYPMPAPGQEDLAAWYYANPRRLNLARLGLVMLGPGARPLTQEDIEHPKQVLDLWTGVVTSRFEIEGAPVEVVTCAHPHQDLLAVRITSPLIQSGRLGVRLAFPGPDLREFTALVGDYSHPGAHRTVLHAAGERRANFVRTVGSTAYYASLAWTQTGAALRPEADSGGHAFTLASGSGDRLDVVLALAPAALPERLPSAAETVRASRVGWPEFWHSGGAIDLSGSKDTRWFELERRIVLSQYLMAVNEAGSQPPQESGLVNNGWHGKFHMEMYWWHAAHYALWNRWPLLNRSLGIYHRLLSSAQAKAKVQGFQGARWPKMIGPQGWESAHPCNALILWQQPHPIFFAELDYRAHPGRQTLDRWKSVVSNTADFLASRAFPNAANGQYVLGPPMFVVSENTDPRLSTNPTFELSYWRFGLRVAADWFRQMGETPNPVWTRVREHLSPLPVEDGVYVLYQGVPEMWKRFAFEHPALIGVYGVLPGDGVDTDTVRRTFHRVLDTWDFNRTWGWDFPMLAMCAARLGEPDKAVDLLLHPAPGFQFDARGLATGGPFPYFPSNGGLLYATALMAGGWDGAPARHAPGFPSDGSWVVRCEGLRPAP